MPHLSAQQLRSTLTTLFTQEGFAPEPAARLAEVHTTNTLYGVHSHGVNRVARFVRHVRQGVVLPGATAEPIGRLGAIERWDGRQGPGVLNALACTDRAVALARAHGLGLVALRHTNHWMRGGYYGWRAAAAGCIGILFTNTQPNMPPWGGQDARLGNNPLVVALPRAAGHVVLDMAMTQYSFGSIDAYRRRGEALPYPGGWNDDNELTTDPATILKHERGLPVGYWKGSALSMVLDMLATLLTAGKSTYRIGQETEETNVSQVFLCIDPAGFGDATLGDRLLDEIITYARTSAPLHEGDRVYYPGERSLAAYRKHLQAGVAVDDGVWAEIIGLLDKIAAEDE